ncbi:MAG: Na+/H+ antiporter subunit E [Rhodospirillales bacterium]|nr:Na+/H+ antiporter subunit E [Rhodospirillales bacterium]
MIHALSLGGALGILWLLLSGIFEAWLLALGFGSIIVIVIIANRMDVIDHEGHPIHISWRALLFWPWLAWEIVKANIDVAKVILHPKLPITPKVLHIKASQVTELGHVFYANSITLTPGTVTLKLINGAMDIHALTPSSIEGLLTGEMDRRVHDVEGMADGTVEVKKNV